MKIGTLSIRAIWEKRSRETTYDVMTNEENGCCHHCGIFTPLGTVEIVGTGLLFCGIACLLAHARGDSGMMKAEFTPTNTAETWLNTAVETCNRMKCYPAPVEDDGEAIDQWFREVELNFKGG